jgi:uncharacterized protein YndB with AHSA1/START domain
METIRHRVGVKAPTSAVYDACATPEGTAQWWTRQVKGEGRVGGKVAFWFGGEEPSAVMEVTELTPGRRVVWRCDDGPQEWLDSTVTFDIRPDGDDTVVMFTHAGWREPVEFMHHCSTAWGSFLISMKHALETGTGAPWPDNEPVSNWG